MRAEVRLQKSLVNGHVVRLLSVEQDDRRVYLVMEFVDGIGLDRILANEGSLPERTARPWFAYLCRALMYCHAQPAPVLHRDVKPANVIVRAGGGDALLCDFGLAETVAPAGARTKLSVVGTPNFLPPELVAASGGSGGGLGGGVVDHPCPLAVDAYAAGVVLYMMLCGTAPFDAADVPRTFRKIRAGRLVFPHGVSGAAKTVIRALLAKDPKARPRMFDVLTGPFLLSVPEVRRLKSSASEEERFVAAQDTRARAGGKRKAGVEKGLVEAPGARGRARARAVASAAALSAERVAAGLDGAGIEVAAVVGRTDRSRVAVEDAGRALGYQKTRRLQSDPNAKAASAHLTAAAAAAAAAVSNNGIDDLLGGADGSAMALSPGAAGAGRRAPGPENVSSAANATTWTVGRAQDRPTPVPRHSSVSGAVGQGGYSRTRRRPRKTSQWPDAPKRADLGDSRNSASNSNTLAASSRSKQRPVSVSMKRCLALYRNLLMALNDGLATAKGELESDAVGSRGGVASKEEVRLAEVPRKARFVAATRRLVVDGGDYPMMVDAWLDMSESHGFATRMSDGRTGCCFNDASIMFNWSAQRDVPDVAYASAADRGMGRNDQETAPSGGGKTSNSSAPRCASFNVVMVGNVAAASSTSDMQKMTPRALSSAWAGSESENSPTVIASAASAFVNSAGVAAVSGGMESFSSAQLTRAAFTQSRTFRAEISEKAKLLVRFRGMLEDADEEVSDEEDDDMFRALRQRHRQRGPGASSCSISFLGEDGAANDPECTESLVDVRGLGEEALVHVRGWQRYKSPRAVAFRLSNDSVQVKIRVGRSGAELGEEDFLLDARNQKVFYRGVDGEGWSCDARDISSVCYSKRVFTRLAFCARVLGRFVSLQ